ncbi:MAG: WYL domain-containing protein [Clostridia bacterium]|jgi:proteasome accessory factor B|nr:WYL domain-containing protein [Clostridia bacterium]
MSDVSQVERQLFILLLLSENLRGLSLEEIIQSLKRVGIDVSKKTVERDIDCITSNFFIYEDTGNGKTVYLANKYKIRNVTFSITELISLYFTRELLNSYKGLNIASTGANILEKIINSVPKVDKTYLETLKNILKVNVTDINLENELNAEFIDILQKAIETCTCVELKYYAFNNDEMTDRVFEPYLLEIYEGCWHVVGHCRLRNKTRDFRVSRIQSLNLTDERFKKPNNFYENYKASRFDKLSGEDRILVRLLFTGYAARLVEEYESHKADVLSRTEEGLVFERTAPMTPEIIKWVLSFGAEVKVVEPVNLRNEVVKQIDNMRKNYILP